MNYTHKNVRHNKQIFAETIKLKMKCTKTESNISSNQDQFTKKIIKHLLSWFKCHCFLGITHIYTVKTFSHSTSTPSVIAHFVCGHIVTPHHFTFTFCHTYNYNANKYKLQFASYVLWSTVVYVVRAPMYIMYNSSSAHFQYAQF